MCHPRPLPAHLLGFESTAATPLRSTSRWNSTGCFGISNAGLKIADSADGRGLWSSELVAGQLRNNGFEGYRGIEALHDDVAEAPALTSFFELFGDLVGATDEQNGCG